MDEFETWGVIERIRFTESDGFIYVSATARISRECAVTRSAINGPLFLTERQFTKPKLIGPGLREISPQSRRSTDKPRNLVQAGNFLAF